MNGTHSHSEHPTPVDIDLDALLAGDSREFEKLVVNESGRLFRVIMRIVNDSEEAQNLVQETFLQAYQRRNTFRRESKLSTWLFAIGINLGRASLRKARRMSSLSEQDIDGLQPEFTRGMFAHASLPWNPEQIAESSDRHRLVHEAINTLPDDYRTIVVLRDIEEYSTDDVADMLNLSSGAVRVRLHRARQALRTLLNSHFQS